MSTTVPSSLSCSFPPCMYRILPCWAGLATQTANFSVRTSASKVDLGSWKLPVWSCLSLLFSVLAVCGMVLGVWHASIDLYGHLVLPDFANVACLMCWFWFGPAAAGLGLLALGGLLTNSSVPVHSRLRCRRCCCRHHPGPLFCMRHCALRHLLVRQSCRHTNLKVCLARHSTAYLRQWLVGDLHCLARLSFGEAERAAIQRSGRVDARSTNGENSDECGTGCRRDSFSLFDDRCVADDVEFHCDWHLD